MITLWGRNNSTNVKKVLWTLEELDLPFKQVMAGPEFGVNKDADYPAMNPNGLVPLLRDDETDATLWESNTIVRYLAAQYGRGSAVGRKSSPARAGRKMDGLGKPDAFPNAPRDPDGAYPYAGSRP